MSQEFDELSDFDVEGEVEAALRRQDEALGLLERLRAEEPFALSRVRQKTGDDRRDFRRWSTPPGIGIEMHDGNRWCKIDCSDLGVGGARTDHLPDWAYGPTPARLSAESAGSILVLSDVMWRGKKSGQAGVRFEFLDEDERDFWSGALIDALLVRHSLK